MPDRLSFDAVLLRLEGESDKVCSGNFGGRSPERGDRTWSKEELDFTDLEGCGFRVGPSSTVFARPNQEEKGRPGQVSDDLLFWRAGAELGVQRVQDGDQKWSDSVWGGVLLAISGKLLRQSKAEVAQSIVSGVSGPHGREDLPN